MATWSRALPVALLAVAGAWSAEAANAGWSPPADLGRDGRQVALAAAGGHVTAVWLSERAGQGPQLRVAVRRAGRFTPPRALSGEGSLASRPRVVALPGGGAVVAWTDTARTSPEASVAPTGVRTAAVRPDGTVSAVRPLGASGASAAELAADGAGSVTAAWTESDAAGDRIVAAVRPAGGEFGASQVVTSSNVESAPSLAVDARGGATVMWEDRPPDEFCGLSYAVRAPGLGFGTPRRLPSKRYCDTGALVGTGARGETTVAWTSISSSDDARVFAASRTGRAPLPTGRPISGKGPASLSGFGLRSLDVDRAGNAVVSLWQRSGSDAVEVAVKRRGSRFGRARRVATVRSGEPYPVAAFADRGRVVAVLNDVSRRRHRVVARTLAARSGRPERPTVLASVPPLYDRDPRSSFPALAYDGGRRLWAAWVRADGIVQIAAETGRR